MIDRVDIIVGGQTYSYAKAGPSTPHPTVQVLWLLEDVIVHNGLCAPPAGIVPAPLLNLVFRCYSAGQQIGTDTAVPYLEWHSELGFDLVPDTVVCGPQQIFDAGLMLPIGPLVPKHNPPASKNIDGGPGSLNGLSSFMAATGQSPEIGLITEPSANFLGFGGGIGPCCAAAKGLRPFASFVFDERTGGKLFDKIKNPGASLYAGQSKAKPGAPDYIAPTPPAPATLPPSWAKWDPAHTPEAGYVSFCATRRLRYLRILQAYANQALLWNMNLGFVATTGPSVSVSQTRVVGRGHENAVMARRATELAESLGLDLASYGLQPSSYFKQICDNNIALFRKYYMADPALDRFGFWPFSTYQSPWMQDYDGIAFGFHAYLYPGEIDDFYLWDLRNVMWRVDGKSGHPPCVQGIYRYNVAPKFGINAHPNPFTTKASDYLPDGAAAFNTFKDATLYEVGGISVKPADFAAAAKDQYNGDNWSGVNIDYPQQVFARLSIAMLIHARGKLDVVKAWPELPQSFGHQLAMLVNWLAKSPGNYMPARTSFLPNLPAPVPVPVPVPPPPTPTPVPAPASPLQIKAGQLLALAQEVNALVNGGG